VLWLLSRASFADRFSRVLVLKEGRVVADGRPGELKEPAWQELLDAA
jgi:ABC-type multidrug transport system fused ATPase/permease subunit